MPLIKVRRRRTIIRSIALNGGSFFRKDWVVYAIWSFCAIKTFNTTFFFKFAHLWQFHEPNHLDEDESDENGHKQAEGYLFSVPIVLGYKDSSGQRTYEVRIDDTLIKTNIEFVKNYVKLEYRDELYKFVALDANDENSGIPISPGYVDELWSKITTYLKFSDAIDISKTPDMANVIIALEPKANYFLSQNLSGIIQTADDDVLAETSLSMQCFLPIEHLL